MEIKEVKPYLHGELDGQHYSIFVDESGELFFDRKDIQEILGYRDHRQLARMRATYPDEFDGEYFEEYTILGECGTPTFGERGLYSLDGLLAISDHTRDYRGADGFLLDIKLMLSDMNNPNYRRINLIGRGAGLLLETRNTTNQLLSEWQETGFTAMTANLQVAADKFLEDWKEAAGMVAEVWDKLSEISDKLDKIEELIIEERNEM